MKELFRKIIRVNYSIRVLFVGEQDFGGMVLNLFYFVV